MKKIQDNLSGAEIIALLRRGHMVRRSCWVDGFFIRITNEAGYDEHGWAIFDEHRDQIYTIATDGYFMHLAWSSQPFREPRVYKSNYTRYSKKHDEYIPAFDLAGRDGSGISMLWAGDWEDWGFVSREGFERITDDTKNKVKDKIEEAQNKAIERAELESERSKA